MEERTIRKIEFAVILCAISAAGTFIHRNLENSRLIPPVTMLLFLFLLFAYCAPEKAHIAADFCFQYRWVIALILFLLCVAFRISGSSIGIYDEIFPTQISKADSTWFGLPRWIRSDEYGVQTPVFFSQAYNGHALYSSRMSLSQTNMVLNYYSPVWDLTALGKPLMWGYLLLGNTTGLSWYWCGLIILLFMTALETIRILTCGYRWISVAGALLIVLSPAIQWWVLPHMPIVILYAMALFTIGYSFFTAKRPADRWGYAFLAMIAIIGFVLSIFPSFQIPCITAVIVLLSVCLRRDRDQITFHTKYWYSIAVPAAASLGILIYFVIVSKADISLLMNTVYPGARISAGGEYTLADLFPDLSSLFLPYFPITYSNSCEAATYIHFAPLFILIFPLIYGYLKRRNSPELPVGLALTVLLILCGVYMIAGIPVTVAKFTLLKYCNRMKGVYGWLAALYTIWGFSILAKYPDLLKRWQKILFPFLYGGICAGIQDSNTVEYFTSIHHRAFYPIGTVYYSAIILLLVGILLAAFFGRKRLTACGLALVMFTAGATVNPIEHGTDALTNHPISQYISEIAEQEPEALWLCTDCTCIMPNFMMANGARVLNATNFYPDEAKWKIIDPENVYETYTNRYANQSASLADSEQTEVELISPDYIHYTLSPETLRALGIRYLLSSADYRELLNSHNIQCRRVSGQDGYEIYRLSYD